MLYIVYTILYWNVHLADCTLGEVRLTSGTADSDFEELTNAGIVGICVNDTQFGRVCNTGWTNRDASVVCRELGFSPYGIYSNKPIRLAIANFYPNTWISSLNSCFNPMHLTYNVPIWPGITASLGSSVFQDYECTGPLTEFSSYTGTRNFWWVVSYWLYSFHIYIIHSGALAVSSDIFYETSSTSGSASSTSVSSPVLECVKCNGSEPRLINCNVASQCSCQTTGYAGVICQGQCSEPLATGLYRTCWNVTCTAHNYVRFLNTYGWLSGWWTEACEWKWWKRGQTGDLFQQSLGNNLSRWI